MAEERSSAALAELIAKQAIRDQLARYCHALDRMDKPMARAVWHDDGTANYIDMFEGTGHGFVDWVWEQHAAMQCHSHQITNVLIEIDGDRARSEAYVTVALWFPVDTAGQRMEIIARSRYLDRWSRRAPAGAADAQGWAIDHRVHVLDTQTMLRLPEGDHAPSQSSRDAGDPSHALFPNP